METTISKENLKKLAEFLSSDISEEHKQLLINSPDQLQEDLDRAAAMVTAQFSSGA